MFFRNIYDQSILAYSKTAKCIYSKATKDLVLHSRAVDSLNSARLPVEKYQNFPKRQ